ncbi:type IV toxin-antitoxin system AbiEi family antitoxin domain-containing protein [Halomonas sp. MC140]|nr:type IV toxin-antitoxin system AbiEi family antitoxin domain-containing protein [Halomonas sp. MC140]MDN7131526.1 type IV toxin-antitoxin system AbiEi family antitoxin domain-containing protein [Halomonas sp. MC140]
MKQSEAIKRLAEFDQRGRYVFSTQDMSKVFLEDTARGREATLKRLVKAGILERPTKGVYLYGLSRNKGPDTLELIGKTLRRGEYSYISLESALSEYGVISQIPVGRLTVMTTGRKGEYKTPYGVIEFTHTKRRVSDILSTIKDRGRPLKVAAKFAALRDLKRVGRNTHLIDEEAVHDD